MEDRDDRVPNRPSSQRLDSLRSQNDRNFQCVVTVKVNVRLAQNVAHALRWRMRLYGLVHDLSDSGMVKHSEHITWTGNFCTPLIPKSGSA